MTSVGNAALCHVLRPPSPLELACAKQAGGEVVFLDSATAAANSFSMVAEAPEEVLTGNIFEDADKLRLLMQEHRQDHVVDLGAPTGGLFGWIGFDGQYTLGRFSKCHVYQHGTQSWLKTGLEPEGITADAASPGDRQQEASPVFKPCMTQADFCTRVRKAQDYIAAGDIYQVNLSYPWQA
ncbi:MAG TPA: hypothetical protein VK956_19890, partial [Verrucomicrobium sp.]|nr:hypothetical protein [Verrucomicrobium sp.]